MKIRISDVFPQNRKRQESEGLHIKKRKEVKPIPPRHMILRESDDAA
jgi:hypothetical protein